MSGEQFGDEAGSGDSYCFIHDGDYERTEDGQPKAGSSVSDLNEAREAIRSRLLDGACNKMVLYEWVRTSSSASREDFDCALEAMQAVAEVRITPRGNIRLAGDSEGLSPHRFDWSAAEIAEARAEDTRRHACSEYEEARARAYEHDYAPAGYRNADGSLTTSVAVKLALLRSERETSLGDPEVANLLDATRVLAAGILQHGADVTNVPGSVENELRQNYVYLVSHLPDVARRLSLNGIVIDQRFPIADQLATFYLPEIIGIFGIWQRRPMDMLLKWLDAAALIRPDADTTEARRVLQELHLSGNY